MAFVPHNFQGKKIFVRLTNAESFDEYCTSLTLDWMHKSYKRHLNFRVDVELSMFSDSILRRFALSKFSILVVDWNI